MRTSDFDPVSVGIFHKQLKNVTIFILLVFGILVLRLWYLQILNGADFRARSELNRIRLQDIPPFRGMILDRNGNRLADNRPAYNLYVIPEEIQDQSQLLKNLEQFAGIDAETFAEKRKEASAARPFQPICLKRDISRDELAVIETHKYNLPGVMIKVEPQRYYLHGKLAFHLLGYLGQISESQLNSGEYPDSKPGDLIGKAGVEMKWQQSLKGQRGGEQVEVDAAGRKIRTISMKPPRPGDNVCLTIDLTLQQAAEKVLEGWNGAVVALDPRNGAVLAMASSPSVDPNEFVGGIDKDLWQEISTSKDFPLQNRALAGQYPPASVFKIIMAMAGLEEGLIDPDETITCRGAFFLGSHRFRCWKRWGHGPVNLHQALVQSCDVYFYTQGMALGVDKIAEYAKRFGYGSPTGLDFGLEKDGLVPTSKWKRSRYGVPWQPGETVATSIGQGFLLVTPIQNAVMISSIFNGGILYRPQMTQWIGASESDKTQEFKPQIAGTLHMDPKNLKIVQQALIGVVNEPHGTAGRARIKGVTVAGKTGTAQVIALKDDEEKTENGEEIPLHHRDHGWFVAVAPAEDPKIAIAIILEHGEHGSNAAPLAKELIEVYLGISPDV